MEYVAISSPGDLLNTGTERRSLALQEDSLLSELPGQPEIKRHLHLGRKSMTNLNNIFKSRDISLLAKVHVVKAMFFLAVMYGCESWTIKKAECQKN